MAIFSRLKYNDLVLLLFVSYTTLSRASIPALFYSASYNLIITSKPGRNAGLSFSHPVNARLKPGAPLTFRPVHAGLAAHDVTQVVRCRQHKHKACHVS